MDPLTKGYPMLTPYQFASNTPIQGIDLDGMELLGYVPGSQELRNGINKLRVKRWEYDSDDSGIEQLAKFSGNSLISIWNGAADFADMALTPAHEGMQNGFHNMEQAYAYFSERSFQEVKEDAVDFAQEKATDPHTYEDIAGILFSRRLSKLRISTRNGFIQVLSREEMSRITGGSRYSRPTPGSKPKRRKIVYIRYDEDGRPYVGITQNTWSKRYSGDRKIREAGALDFLEDLPLDFGENRYLLNDIENAILDHWGGPENPRIGNKIWSDSGGGINPKPLGKSIQYGQKWLDKNVPDWKSRFDLNNYTKE